MCTGKNNWFPFLDILGYLKNTHKNPKFGKVRDKSQPGNSQPSSLIGTCLTLPNFGFLWVFFKYPKISKNGNQLFFPVVTIRQAETLCQWQLTQANILKKTWNNIFANPKRLTLGSHHRDHDGSCSGRALNKNSCQDANHKASHGVAENLIRSEGLASGFSSQQAKGTAQEIQRTDEQVQKTKE